MHKLIILAFSFVISGCKDLTFGDKAEGYLKNGDAVSDANEYIKRDLTFRWNNSFQLFFNDFMIRNKHLLELMNSLEVPNIPSKDELEDYNEEQLTSKIIELHNLEKIIQGGLDNVYHIKNGLKDFSEICENEGFVRSLRLDEKILHNFGSIALPDIDDIYVYKISTDPGQNIGTFIDTIGFLFKKSEYKKQVKKLNESFDYFRRNVIQGNEFYALSKGICLRDRPRFDVASNSLSMTMSSLSDHIHIKHNKLSSVMMIYQSYLTPIIYQKIEDIFGSRELLSSFNQESFYSDLNRSFNNERDMFNGKLLNLALLDKDELVSQKGQELLSSTHDHALKIAIETKRLLTLNLRPTEATIYKQTLNHFTDVIVSLEKKQKILQALLLEMEMK